MKCFKKYNTRKACYIKSKDDTEENFYPQYIVKSHLENIENLCSEKKNS